MANTFRYIKGDAKIVKAPVDSATVIEIGDLVYLDTDDVKPASSETYLSTLAQTQEAFHDHFMGVALDPSASGDTADIRVATGGVFEPACAAATFEPGDLVGPDDNAGATALEDQQVIAVALPQYAVGRVWRRYVSNTTKVQVEIVSTTQLGGPQAAA